jgi:hypothetical protein
VTFCGSREPVRIFYIEINGSVIFDIRIFALRTAVMERIMFVNLGLNVLGFRICKRRPSMIL